MTRGRKPFDTRKEAPTDRYSRLKHRTQDWRMVRLQRLLEQVRQAQFTESKARLECDRKAAVEKFEAMTARERERRRTGYEQVLKRYDKLLAELPQTSRLSPDNFLSARAAEITRRIARKEHVFRDDEDHPKLLGVLYELDFLWRDARAEFERAVLAGDAVWFKRQAKAMSEASKPIPDDQFAAKVDYLLRFASLREPEPPLPQPRRKHEFVRVGVHHSAEEILDELDVTELSNGVLLVAGRKFGARGTHTARDRALGQIHRMAKQRGVTLRNQQGKRRSTDSKSGDLR